MIIIIFFFFDMHFCLSTRTATAEKRFVAKIGCMVKVIRVNRVRWFYSYHHLSLLRKPHHVIGLIKKERQNLLLD